MKRRGFLQGITAAIAFLSATTSALGASMARAYSKVGPAKHRIPLPPLPKWNKATDDLDRADYIRRSEDCERLFLPRNLVFPREGEIWEAVRDCEVHGLRRMMNPKGGMMFWGNVKLRKGERVRILPLDHPKPLQVKFQCLASEHAEYELFLRLAHTVPSQTSAIPYFSDLFRLV